MKPVSGKRFARALERKGWILHRVPGSHFIYKHPAKPGARIVVPIHGNRDLKRGTQHALMKQAGLTDADL